MLKADMRFRSTSSRAQAGLSLVELMVGIAVGLIIVAGASMLVATQLSENRKLLLETQVQQDLRATADIISRELRRSGYDQNAVNGVWLPDQPNTAVRANFFAALDLTAPDAPTYFYTRPGNNQFALKLEGGVLSRKIGGGAWQAMTDIATVRISRFNVVAQPVTKRALACPKLCPPTAAIPTPNEDCWPTLDVRDLIITIDGTSVSDPDLVRQVVSRVRVRSDKLEFNLPDPLGAPNPNLVCP